MLYHQCTKAQWTKHHHISSQRRGLDINMLKGSGADKVAMTKPMPSHVNHPTVTPRVTVNVSCKNVEDMCKGTGTRDKGSCIVRVVRTLHHELRGPSVRKVESGKIVVEVEVTRPRLGNDETAISPHT